MWDNNYWVGEAWVEFLVVMNRSVSSWVSIELEWVDSSRVHPLCLSLLSSLRRAPAEVDFDTAFQFSSVFVTSRSSRLVRRARRYPIIGVKSGWDVFSWLVWSRTKLSSGVLISYFVILFDSSFVGSSPKQPNRKRFWAVLLCTHQLFWDAIVLRLVPNHIRFHSKTRPRSSSSHSVAMIRVSSSVPSVSISFSSDISDQSDPLSRLVLYPEWAPIFEDFLNDDDAVPSRWRERVGSNDHGRGENDSVAMIHVSSYVPSVFISFHISENK